MHLDSSCYPLGSAFAIPPASAILNTSTCLPAGAAPPGRFLHDQNDSGNNQTWAGLLAVAAPADRHLHDDLVIPICVIGLDSHHRHGEGAKVQLVKGDGFNEGVLQTRYQCLRLTPAQQQLGGSGVRATERRPEEPASYSAAGRAVILPCSIIPQGNWAPLV